MRCQTCSCQTDLFGEHGSASPASRTDVYVCFRAAIFRAKYQNLAAGANLPPAVLFYSNIRLSREGTKQHEKLGGAQGSITLTEWRRRDSQAAEPPRAFKEQKKIVVGAFKDAFACTEPQVGCNAAYYGLKTLSEALRPEALMLEIVASIVIHAT